MYHYHHHLHFNTHFPDDCQLASHAINPHVGEKGSPKSHGYSTAILKRQLEIISNARTLQKQHDIYTSQILTFGDSHSHTRHQLKRNFTVEFFGSHSQDCAWRNWLWWYMTANSTIYNLYHLQNSATDWHRWHAVWIYERQRNHWRHFYCKTDAGEV